MPKKTTFESIQILKLSFKVLRHPQHSINCQKVDLKDKFIPHIILKYLYIILISDH